MIGANPFVRHKERISFVLGRGLMPPACFMNQPHVESESQQEKKEHALSLKHPIQSRSHECRKAGEKAATNPPPPWGEAQKP